MMQELNYIRCSDYYIPDIRLPEETRPIGRWGRMHRDYIKEHKHRLTMVNTPLNKALGVRNQIFHSNDTRSAVA